MAQALLPLGSYFARQCVVDKQCRRSVCRYDWVELILGGILFSRLSFIALWAGNYVAAFFIKWNIANKDKVATSLLINCNWYRTDKLIIVTTHIVDILGGR